MVIGRIAERAVLLAVPPGAKPEGDAATAHGVRRGRHLREQPRRPVAEHGLIERLSKVRLSISRRSTHKELCPLITMVRDRKHCSCRPGCSVAAVI